MLLLVTGGVCMAAGWGLQELGVCPVVKRIWTPAWTLFSAGWCFAILGALFAALDLRPNRALRGLVFPLLVIGANSIVAYIIDHTVTGFIGDSFKTHLGPDVFKCFGDIYEATVRGAAVLVVVWLMLLWMYRQRVFVRI